MERSAAIILALSSLPSPHGIGTLGQAAFDFTDFATAAGFRYWQLLPLGPTGYGDSPYQSFSGFAGNPYLIDLDLLVEEGLLTREEVEGMAGSAPADQVDYGHLYASRFALLARAKTRGWERHQKEREDFERAQAGWLPDYTLFMALKRHFDMQPWTAWPAPYRLRQEAALDDMRRVLKDDIELFTYIQFLFFRQWEALRSYLKEKDLKLIGDLPIYPALDSADVWASPQFFELDQENKPLAVAGVPPDYFSEEGQLWGNPLYRWDRMQADGFGWWIRRIEGAARLFDVIRIDHFRGFDTYWAVPAEAKSAKEGAWRQGPGMALISVLNNWFPNLSFIAEDLGAPAESVVRLLEESGWPGMKVLEFAFDPGEESSHLPHHHRENCICYSSTHDNIPLAGWAKGLDPAARRYIMDYLGLSSSREIPRGILRAGLMSVAKIFAAPIQDYLGLGEASAMNRPGSAQGNWRWRLKEGELSSDLARKISALLRLYGRRH